jgi:hypothetical protein
MINSLIYLLQNMKEIKMVIVLKHARIQKLIHFIKIAMKKMKICFLIYKL